MWSAIQRFMGSYIGRIGAFTFKGIHLIIAAAITITGLGVGTGVYIVVQQLNAGSHVRTVVVTINGVNTSLDTKCHYHAIGASGGTFDAIDRGLVGAGFTNPYQTGCPSSTASNGSGAGSLLDIAEYSYANSPGAMKNGHWAPGSFSTCTTNTNTLDKDSQNLAALLDAYSAVYPDAHFELVGHSLGGVVALQGATDYENHHGRAIITKVITLDSPMHGRGGGQAVGAAAVSLALNVVGRCSPRDRGTDLGQMLSAMAADGGDLAATETAILASHGVEVYTLGNLDDCLYQHTACASSLAKFIDLTFGGFGGASLGVLTELAGLVLVPSATNTQFVDGTYQRRYHLGQSGFWPGGHGAILDSTQSVSDIVWLLADAPSAALFITTTRGAAPQLHLFVTGPQKGVEAVTAQVTSSNGKVVQQFTLNGAGAVAYTDTLNLDPKAFGAGPITATITSVTDSQNLEHQPQTANDGSNSQHHDFVARVTYTNN